MSKPKGVDYSRWDRVDEFAEERREAIKAEEAKIRRQERERKEREAAQGSKKAVGDYGGRTAVCTVRCDNVTLKLTLKDKFLDRPFGTAVVEPFLKAFNKKREKVEAPPVALSQLAGLVVDGSAHADLARALGTTTKHVILDTTKGANDESAFVSTFHESWKPATGVCWDTTHEVTLLLGAAALGTGTNEAPVAAPAPAPVDDGGAVLEVN